MKTYLYRTIAAAAMACISAPAITATAQAPTSSYNFQYKRTGEQQLLPLQVFDDGKETYFQFSERTQVLPAILVESTEGVVVSKYHRSGPYVVVAGVASSYRLQFGSLSGSVQYAGPARTVTAGRSSERQDERAPAQTPGAAPTGLAPAAVGATVPATLTPTAAPSLVPAVARSVPAPAYGLVAPLGESETQALRADTANKSEVRVEFGAGKSAPTADSLVELRAATIKGDATKIVITGRDDATFVEGLARARALAIRTVLLKFGVPADRITLREGLPTSSDASRPTSDVSIARASPSPKAMDAAAPATVGEALALVARGLYGLVRLKAIDEARAGEIIAGVKRLASGGKDELPAPLQQTKVEAKPADETWTMVPADGTAQRGLRRWAERAGLTLDWQADVDYPISAPIVVKGTARTAINTLRDALATAKKPLIVELDNARVVVRNARG